MSLIRWTLRIKRLWLLPIVRNMLLAVLTQAMLLIWSTPVLAVMDLSIKTGVAGGQLTQERQAGTQKINLGGVPVVLALHQDFSRRWSFQGQFQLMLDVLNRSISQQAVALGFDFHLFGGGRRIVRSFDETTIISRNPSSLSLLSRISLSSYSLADEQQILTIQGSTLEVRGGLSYRRDLTSSTGYGVELISPLLSFPGSTERLQANIGEILIYWRFFY